VAVDYMKAFKALIIFGAKKRVFFQSEEYPVLPLCSFLQSNEKFVGGKKVGLSAPFPIPIFDPAKELEALPVCGQTFTGAALELTVSPATNKEKLLMARFIEKEWPGPLFTNAWKKRYESALPLAREKARHELYRVGAQLRGTEKLLSCISSGSPNKLIINGKEAILCSKELSALLMPTPRAAAMPLSDGLRPAKPPSAQRGCQRATQLRLRSSAPRRPRLMRPPTPSHPLPSYPSYANPFQVGQLRAVSYSSAEAQAS